MKEIKFRAWSGKQMLTMPMGGIYGMSRFFGFMDSAIGFSDQSGVFLMQYTGLKDKAGVEIYEGDILTYYAGWSHGDCIEGVPPQFIGYVIWDNEDAAWEIKQDDDVDLVANYCGKEVVGNIYENPELLEQP